jgi:TRAP-type C4-dicarboxylate transport system permease small subunit
MVAEIVVLFAGVLARYVFHAPLVWSDEVASILFLWLGILGAALALTSNTHLRMTTVVTRLPASWRGFVEPLSLAVCGAFLALLMMPALKYVDIESATITATLGVSMLWRAVAMPIGIALMLVIVLLQMRHQPARAMLAALAVVVVACAALWLLRPYFAPLGKLNLLIFFVAFVPLLVFSSIPIGMSFGMATLGYILLATRVPGSVLVARIDAGMSNFLLISIPLFVFLGLVIEMTGMAERMVRFLASLIGHTKGGLHYVLVAAMYLVSGISGSKAADMAAVAPALFPEMEKYGAERDAGELGGALGRDPPHRRRRDRHGLGHHLVGLLADPGADDRRGAGRPLYVHRALDPALRRLGQRARGPPRHRALRPADVPDRAPRRGRRDPLRDDRHPLDGPRAFHAALRHRLLHLLRHRRLRS